MSFRGDIYGNHLKKVLNQIEAGEASFKPSAREKEKKLYLQIRQKNNLGV